jgi:cytochrome c peroxidase
LSFGSASWALMALGALSLGLGCGHSGATSATNPACGSGYPSGVLPDLELDGLDASGAEAKVALHAYFEPCAGQSRLLVLRVSAAWCGTCRWQVAHTGELGQLDVAPRVRLLDLLVADEDNAPPTAASLHARRALGDAPSVLAADAAFSLRALLPSGGSLPLLAFVDTRSMKVVRALGDPDPDTLPRELRAALAELDGAPGPASDTPTAQDGRFTREQWDLLQSMKLPDVVPPDPSNAKADDPGAAALGKKLFSDAALSPSGKVSCASCHDPTKELADGLPQSTGGTARVDRNAPAIGLAAHARWQFWDGRADSLWMQALGPPEVAAEFGSSRLFVDHVVWGKYKASYEAVWGPLPDLSSGARFPASGKPGSPEWATMSADDQDAATRVYVNVGKSIAAYERSFRVEPNALDRYVGGDVNALTAAEKDGLAAFFRSGCAQCHYGPRLTDDAFHVAGLPTGRLDGQPDRGRIDGVDSLHGAEFGQSSTWSDAPSAAAPLKPSSSMLGAFKTPTLRGAPDTAPYGHGGTSPTLEDVIAKHGFVQAQSPLVVGAVEPWFASLDPASIGAIVAFLRTLRAEPIVP